MNDCFPFLPFHSLLFFPFLSPLSPSLSLTPPSLPSLLPSLLPTLSLYFPVSPPPPPASSLHARLMDGNSSMSGRVELNHNGEGWGTICDNHWTIRDADVVCHMLEFRSALSAFGSGHFGQGSGPILLDNVTCVGYETSLSDCILSRFGVTPNCQHSNDVGVVCSGEYPG